MCEGFGHQDVYTVSDVVKSIGKLITILCMNMRWRIAVVNPIPIGKAGAMVVNPG